MGDHKLGLPADDLRRTSRVPAKKVSDRAIRPAGLRLPGMQRLDGLVLKARLGWKRLLFAAIAFAPTLGALVYYPFIASDRYTSEASFVVRSAAKPMMSGGLSSFLDLAGVTRSQDDAFAVHEFMTSRDAVTQLSRALPLREMFGRDEADFASGYPSIFYGPSEEDLYAYFKTAVSVSYSGATGISRLKVDVFRAQDAQLIASHLLDLSEELVNKMNRNIHEDAVGFAQEDVASAQDRLIHSQALLTAFRNRELTIDPDAGVRTLAELTGKLSAELAALKARVAELEASAPQSPLLPGLRSRVAALEQQLEAENQRVAASGEDGGLARKISEYEGLMIAHQFANEDLGRALAGLELARGEARKQQLFLERVVQPSLPDSAGEPRRFSTIMAVLAANLILFLVAWFVWAGVREHSSANS